MNGLLVSSFPEAGSSPESDQQPMAQCGIAAETGPSGSSPQHVLDEAAAAVREELAGGDPDFALRLALDALRRLQAMGPATLLEPPPTGDRRWDALLAAAARIALRGAKTEPGWGSPLPEPWFPAEDLRGRMSEAYLQLTVRRTPREFEAFNIFLNVASPALEPTPNPGA